MFSKKVTTNEAIFSKKDDGIATLNESMKELLMSIIDGRLDTRVDLEKVDTAHRPILKNVNDILDAVIAPLNVAAEYVDRISKGDIPEKITDDYKGDFNEMTFPKRSPTITRVTSTRSRTTSTYVLTP